MLFALLTYFFIWTVCCQNWEDRQPAYLALVALISVVLCILFLFFFNDCDKVLTKLGQSL